MFYPNKLGSNADSVASGFQVELNEMRMDAKIDMLHQSGLLGKAPGNVGLSLRKSSESDARIWRLKDVSRISNFHEGHCPK
jgi:hypothetical protein